MNFIINNVNNNNYNNFNNNDLSYINKDLAIKYANLAVDLNSKKIDHTFIVVIIFQ